MVADIVEQGHHCGYGGIELHSLDILSNLFDGLMECARKLGSLASARRDIGQGSDTVEKALAAADGIIVPRCGRAVITHKEYIGTERIRAELVDDIVRVNDVAERL